MNIFETIVLLAFAADEATLTTLFTAITGAGGAIVVAVLWVWSLHRQNRELMELIHSKDKVIQTKDERLLAITRESIACIEASLARREEDTDFRRRLEELMRKVTTNLDKAFGN